MYIWVAAKSQFKKCQIDVNSKCKTWFLEHRLEGCRSSLLILLRNRHLQIISDQGGRLTCMLLQILQDLMESHLRQPLCTILAILISMNKLSHLQALFQKSMTMIETSLFMALEVFHVSWMSTRSLTVLRSMETDLTQKFMVLQESPKFTGRTFPKSHSRDRPIFRTYSTK